MKGFGGPTTLCQKPPAARLWHRESKLDRLQEAGCAKRKSLRHRPEVCQKGVSKLKRKIPAYALCATDPAARRNPDGNHLT